MAMRDGTDDMSGVESGRFVWPPRPVDVAPAQLVEREEVSGSVDGAAEIDDGLDGGPGAPEAREPGAAAVQRSGRWSWLTRAVLEMERVWLGQVRAPLSVRIEEAGWAADGAEAYCRRCGMTAGPHEAGESGCPACRTRRIGCERIVRLGEFRGLLREVVLEIKFTRWRRLGSQVGRMLGESLAGELEAAGVDIGKAVLVPVPTSFRRRMARGIDHPLVIARGVSGATGIPIVRALERKHRPAQQSLPASRRMANLVGAIRVRKWAPSLLAGKVVVLVDDVSTTGATLWAAYRAVGGGKRKAEAEGMRVWAAVVAVTPEAGRGADDRVQRAGVRGEGVGSVGRELS